MVSTTDLDEAPGLHLLLPPIPEPAPGDEPLAGRGHPGGPGFTPEGSPAGPLAGASRKALTLAFARLAALRASALG